MPRLTAEDMDELLKPYNIKCGVCGREDAIAFPAPHPGVIYCPCTSPEWLKSFALFSTNRLRERQGFEAINLSEVEQCPV